MRDEVCADCGGTFSAPNKATLYCNVHRLQRNLNHFGATTVKCIACGERFCPVQAKDFLCANHPPATIRGQGRHTVQERCRICGTETSCYSKDIRICVPCLKAPSKRQEVLRRVNKKAGTYVAS